MVRGKFRKTLKSLMKHIMKLIVGNDNKVKCFVNLKTNVRFTKSHFPFVLLKVAKS